MPDHSLLIIDNNEQECVQLKNYFEECGYRVTACTDYLELSELLSRKGRGPDMLMLSCAGPDEKVMELLECVKRYPEMAVMILSTDSRVESQLAFYERQIDELLVKPVHISLVQAHADAIIRRTAGKYPAEETAGGLTLNYESRKVFLDGKQIRFTTKEFDLLEYFMRHRGVTLSRDKILDSVWGFDYVGSYRSVDTLIKKIRAKLTEKHPYIKTVYGAGYCFDIQEESDNERQI